MWAANFASIIVTLWVAIDEAARLASIPDAGSEGCRMRNFIAFAVFTLAIV